MSWYGSAFLEASIGPVIRRLCEDKVSIEVDPLRSSKNMKGLEKNVESLVYWCQEFWTHIYDARTQCPVYVSGTSRRVFYPCLIFVQGNAHVVRTYTPPSRETLSCG